MQYCVALALTQDLLSLSDFSPEAVARPHVRALFSRIEMETMPLEEEIAQLRPAHRAQITLKDGRSFSAALAHARGTLHDPLDEVTRVGKLRDCFDYAGLVLDDAGLALLSDIDGQNNLTELCGLLESRAAALAGAD